MGSVPLSSIGGVLVLATAAVTTILLVVTVALTVLVGTSLASVLAAVILLVVARAVIVLVTALAGVRGVLATGTRALGVTSGVEAVRLGRGVLASLVQGLVDGIHADLLSRVDGHGAGLQAHVHLVDAVNGRDLLGDRLDAVLAGHAGDRVCRVHVSTFRWERWIVGRTEMTSGPNGSPRPLEPCTAGVRNRVEPQDLTSRAMARFASSILSVAS